MKLESQVVSLEIAKRFKELGCSQTAFLVWEQIGPETKLIFSLNKDTKPTEFDPFVGRFYSAFSVAELGEMLPYDLSFPRKLRSGKWWIFMPVGLVSPTEPTPGPSDTEADARGRLLIHLLEKGLVKPEQL